MGTQTNWQQLTRPKVVCIAAGVIVGALLGFFYPEGSVLGTIGGGAIGGGVIVGVLWNWFIE